MTARLIDGKAIAARVRGEIREKCGSFTERTGITPHLAAILVGDDAASQVYVRNKQRACEKALLKSTLHRLPGDISQNDLLQLIADLNGQSDVHGILVQLPLPEHISETAVLDAVTPLKDVDAFHPENVGRLIQGRPRFLPCTPAGIQRMLEVEQIETRGKHAVVIGRSEIVGKPMAAMLVQRGPGADATVTVCHSRSHDLPSITRQADLLIAAVGRPRFVTGDMIKPGAVVIDVGINRVDNQLVGDVHFEQALEVASAVTPVPGGVGPMTIAMLLENTLRAAELAAAAA